MIKVPVINVAYDDANDTGFLAKANASIKVINTFIDTYNKETDREKKLATLKTINTLRKKLEDDCPDDFPLSELDEQVLVGLFHDCKQEFAKFGFNIDDIDKATSIEQSDATISIDNLRYLILGQNYYQRLTGCESHELYEPRLKKGDPFIPITDGTKLDFSSPKFQTPDGIQIKKLICNLIEKNPAKRISIQEAADTLEILELIKKLSKLKLTEDTEYDQLNGYIEFLYEKLKIIQTLDKPKEKLSILKQEISNLVEENEKMVNFLRLSIKKIEGSSVQQGKKEKIEAIKEAYARVPIHQRGGLMETKNPSKTVKEVRSALGIWRSYFFNYRPWFSSMSGIFHKYKKLYQEESSKKAQKKSPEETQPPQKPSNKV